MFLPAPDRLARVYKRRWPYLQQGLVGWWPFDSRGLVQEDYSGNGNRVVLSGATLPRLVRGRVPALGRPGGALNFDGSTSQGNCTYRSGTNSNGLGITTKSLFAWAYIPAAMTGGWQTICQYNRGGAETYGLWRSGNTGNTWSWRVNGNIAGDFTQVITNGKWYHIGFTWAAGSPGTVRVYQNGAQDSTGSGNVQVPAAGASLTIGYDLGGEYFPGYIDDLRIYNRVLSASEVKALYLSAFQPIEEFEMDALYIPPAAVTIGGATLPFMGVG